jgi:hypothetical protein
VREYLPLVVREGQSEGGEINERNLLRPAYEIYSFVPFRSQM